MPTRLRMSNLSNAAPYTFRSILAGILLAGYVAHTVADTYAIFESGDFGIVLLTDPCPVNQSGELRLAIENANGKLREGCYVINNRNNPVVKWQDGAIQELDGSAFRVDPKQAIVKRELHQVMPDSPRPSPPLSTQDRRSNDSVKKAFAINTTPLGGDFNGKAITVLTTKSISGEEGANCLVFNRPKIYFAVVYFENDGARTGTKDGCWVANDRGDVAVRIAKDVTREFKLADFQLAVSDLSIPTRALTISDLPAGH